MSSLNINEFVKQILEKQLTNLEEIYNTNNITIEQKNFIESYKFTKDSIVSLLLDNINIKIDYTNVEHNVENNVESNKKSMKIKKKKGKKYLEPSKFDNEYKYFIYMCNKLSYDYYRLNLSTWQGPAILLNDKIQISKIKKQINIELNIDCTSNNSDLFVIYPKNKSEPESITYSNYYSLPNEVKINNIDVIEWSCNDIVYLIDKNNNNVYNNDIENSTIIGMRVYDSNSNTWYIKSINE